MNNGFNTRKLVMLALLAAVLFLMAFTPLGYLRIGALSITFNTIPVAIGAIALGPVCGAILGLVFGLTSVMGGSALVVTLMSVSPVRAVILCIVPRILEGLLAGFVAKGLNKTPLAKSLTFGITGFLTAFFNTLFFMSALIILFGNSEYVLEKWQALAPGSNAIVFVCAFVGINAVIEMASTALISSAVSLALYKSRLLTKA